MTTETLTLSAFLLARIAEDEAVALAASEGQHWEWTDNGEDLMSDFQGEPYSWGTPRDECIIATEGANPPDAETAGAHIARHDPARVLATCKAHRAIVEMDSLNSQHRDVILRTLASIYADHPDFQESWRA